MPPRNREVAFDPVRRWLKIVGSRLYLRLIGTFDLVGACLSLFRARFSTTASSSSSSSASLSSDRTSSSSPYTIIQCIHTLVWTTKLWRKKNSKLRPKNLFFPIKHNRCKTSVAKTKLCFIFPSFFIFQPILNLFLHLLEIIYYCIAFILVL